MLCCIVTSNLWLHFNKLLTYLLTYLLTQLDVELSCVAINGPLVSLKQLVSW